MWEGRDTHCLLGGSCWKGAEPIGKEMDDFQVLAVIVAEKADRRKAVRWQRIEVRPAKLVRGMLYPYTLAR